MHNSHFPSAMTILLIVLLLLLGCSFIQGNYYYVTDENCAQEQSTESLFKEFLLPCANYKLVSKEDLKCLTQDEQTVGLKTLPSWELVKNETLGNSLKKTFVFEDFQNAFLFMSRGKSEINSNFRSIPNILI